MLTDRVALAVASMRAYLEEYESAVLPAHAPGDDGGRHAFAADLRTLVEFCDPTPVDAEPAPDGGGRWWTLPEEVLRELLGRARVGEEPGALLVELYANSDVEQEGQGG